MKLAKFRGLVKHCNRCVVVHVKNNGIWLGTQYGLYRAEELPELESKEEVAAVLDFGTKDLKKIMIEERDATGREDVLGMDLRDGATYDIRTSRAEVAAVVDGKFANMLVCDDDELVFYDPALLAPVADVLKEREYAEIVVRKMRSGSRYIVVRDGYNVLAGIMPMNIITKEYLAALADYKARCTAQYSRNNGLMVDGPDDLGADEEQIEMEDGLNDD